MKAATHFNANISLALIRKGKNDKLTYRSPVDKKSKCDTKTLQY